MKKTVVGCGGRRHMKPLPNETSVCKTNSSCNLYQIKYYLKLVLDMTYTSMLYYLFQMCTRYDIHLNATLFVSNIPDITYTSTLYFIVLQCKENFISSLYQIPQIFKIYCEQIYLSFLATNINILKKNNKIYI